MNLKKVTSALIAVFMMALAVPTAAFAAPSTEVVLEANVKRQLQSTPPTSKWVIYTNVSTPATAATFRNSPADPALNAGSLELTTTDGGHKVSALNYSHIGKPLSGIDTVSYDTYRTAGNGQQVAALNVVIDFNGPDVADGFSTLVFEPVYNTDQGEVVSGVWQDWIANNNGVWWSTKPLNNQCAGATSACDMTWNEIVANNPNATILGGVGINQGGGNPGLKTAVDAFTFDETTYDFELVAPKPMSAMSKDECKNGNWQNGFQTQYKNQGDCVSSVASNSRANGNPSVMESTTAAFRSLFN